MNTKLFVGNLSYQMDDSQLKAAFSEVGEVTDVFVPVDRMTGKKRGFAFVTMATPELASKAIESMNGKDIDGRQITVSEAKPMENNRPRSGGRDNDGYRRF
ncbi:MAG: RNA-binding protein [bacterium]